MKADTKYRLSHAVTSDDVAGDILSTIADVSPVLKTSKEEIETRLATALAGPGAFGDQAGDRLAKKVVGLFIAKTEDFAAVAASYTGQVAGMATPVTISADVAGAAGNAVILTGDGAKNISTLISDWNGTNPEQITLDSGTGTQTPNNGTTIALSGGKDADTTGKTLATGTVLSEVDKSCLAHALTDESAAADFLADLDAAIALL